MFHTGVIYGVPVGCMCSIFSYNIQFIQVHTKMAHIRNEDSLDRLYLSLLSSPKDCSNPNTGVYSYNMEAQGKGVWITLIDTGFDWERFPEVSRMA